MIEALCSLTFITSYAYRYLCISSDGNYWSQNSEFLLSETQRKLKKKKKIASMSAQQRRRTRRSSALKFCVKHRRRISDSAIVRGVEVEFDRTLPYWRCYTDLCLETGRKPEVAQRTTQLLCRIPCKVFKHVDVVWARTEVQLLRTTKNAKSITRPHLRAENGSSKPSPTRQVTSPAVGNNDAVRCTIDTMHFVHDEAYKKGAASEHSFHVQSVVLRDAPAVLQCVAGAMVSFSFLVYTSLRLIHMCKVKDCHVRQLGREVEALLRAYTPNAEEDAHVKRVRREGEGHEADTATAATSPRVLHSLSGACTGNGSAKSAAAVSVAEKLREWCPSSTSRVLILGMGGNSMALALRSVLGPAAVIEVVEVEPAVMAACRRVGTLGDSDANMIAHLQDADTCWRTLPVHTFDFIFMDIFEPMEATMKNLHPWVTAAKDKLTAGGLLVMNEHQLPSAEGLAPYARLFGDDNVQAVNLRGWNESVVVCVAPGNAETDSHTLAISKSYADVAFNIYEALLPGWLPHFSWLVRAKTHYFEKTRCRLWTS